MKKKACSRSVEIRVLLVDDNASFLEIESNFLSRQPEFKIVGSATSGEGALTQVVNLRPDLVLMDLTMPGMNGMQATSQIKKQPNAPRIIIVTLHDQPAYREMCENAGADGFITKDNFGAALVHMIHGLFDPTPAPRASSDSRTRN
jgi:DNA-binding NarL/FixJ family response regulator